MSVSRFFDFFEFLSDVAVTMTCVSIMLDVISSVSIWSLYSNFCLNLIPFFVKIVQFCPSPN